MMTASAGQIQIGTSTDQTTEGTLGSVTVGAMALFGIIDVAMNFLRTDLDPAVNAQTRYALGEWGFLMIFGFLAMGLGSMSVVLGVNRRIGASTAARLGLAMLAAWSVCIVAGAGVRLDPLGVFPANGTTLHTALTVVGFVCASVGITALTVAFRRDGRWVQIYGLAALLAAVTVTAFGLMVASSFVEGPGEIFPLSQRVVILGIALWLGVVGGELRRGAGR